MNWYVIIIVGIILVGLVIFIIIRNRKDKKELEQKLNSYFPIKKEGEGDGEIGEEKLK
jgi:preprotein translocase subunit YajC